MFTCRCWVVKETFKQLHSNYTAEYITVPGLKFLPQLLVPTGQHSPKIPSMYTLNVDNSFPQWTALNCVFSQSIPVSSLTKSSCSIVTQQLDTVTSCMNKKHNIHLDTEPTSFPLLALSLFSSSSRSFFSRASHSSRIKRWEKKQHRVMLA